MTFKFLCSLLVIGCVTPRRTTQHELPITKKTHKSESSLSVLNKNSDSNFHPVKTDPVKVELSRCIPYPKNLFLPDLNVAITTATKICSDSTVPSGFLPESDFIAMGFPCSGGDGRVDWKGNNYAKPKMVSFLLETNCPVANVTSQQILSSLEKLVGKKLTGKILAINPFMVQFWQAPGLDDSDSSFSVDLRSHEALDKVWTNFATKNTPIPVQMYGRENAWTNQDAFFGVTGEIFSTAKNRFRLRVKHAEKLENNQIEELKKNCESLRPTRDCSIF